MRVRQANTADASRIAEIYVRSWQTAYRGIVSGAILNALSIKQRERLWVERLAAGEASQTLVVEDDAQVQGWAGFGACRDADSQGAAEVYAIYLDPRVYRRGYGRLLWSGVCEQLALRRHERLAVWVLQANVPARRFYEAMGGQLDASVQKVFERNGVKLPEARYWCPVQITRRSETGTQLAPKPA